MNANTIGSELVETALSVAFAVAPLLLFFVGFQVFFLRLPRREVGRILVGTLIASLGLYIFLLGVSVAFLPYGRAVGEALGSLSRKWLLVPLGMALGYVTTWSEPAVRILVHQVEEASSGSLRRPLVLNAICLGVAGAVGTGLFRIGYGLELLWVIVPGYALALAMMLASERAFVGIAVDAGGVATGPLANSFLLALGFGASSAVGDQDPLVHGLGLVALIALAPVLSVMLLGLVVQWKERKGR